MVIKDNWIHQHSTVYSWKVIGDLIKTALSGAPVTHEALLNGLQFDNN